jgi:hypothetical protein
MSASFILVVYSRRRVEENNEKVFAKDGNSKKGNRNFVVINIHRNHVVNGWYYLYIIPGIRAHLTMLSIIYIYIYMANNTNNLDCQIFGTTCPFFRTNEKDYIVWYGWIKYIKQKISSTKATLRLKLKRTYIIGYMVVDGRIANQWKVGNESRNVLSVQIADLQWCTTY